MVKKFSMGKYVQEDMIDGNYNCCATPAGNPPPSHCDIPQLEPRGGGQRKRCGGRPLSDICIHDFLYVALYY